MFSKLIFQLGLLSIEKFKSSEILNWLYIVTPVIHTLNVLKKYSYLLRFGFCEIYWNCIPRFCNDQWGILVVGEIFISFVLPNKSGLLKHLFEEGFKTNISGAVGGETSHIYFLLCAVTCTFLSTKFSTPFLVEILEKISWL